MVAHKDPHKKGNRGFISNSNNNDINVKKISTSDNTDSHEEQSSCMHPCDEQENKPFDILCRKSWSDKRLYEYSIQVFKAHVRMCIKRSIVDEVDGKKLMGALEKVEGSLCVALQHSLEKDVDDIHSRVKTLVSKEVGDLAHILNVAHSTHEHDVTVMRMWMRDSLDELSNALQHLQVVLLEKIESHIKIVIPSYLHNRAFQPISLGHYLMNYVEILDRDRERVANIRDIVDRSPMGAYLSAGSSFDINRRMVAKILGFNKVIYNSMDAILSRDFVIDFMYVFAICSVHLATVAQDLIQWGSEHRGFISFTCSVSTISDGVFLDSSYYKIMECVRSKSGLAIGNLVHTFVTLKGLESGFSRDLAELTEPVLRDSHVLIECVKAISMLIANFTVNKKRTKKSTESPYGFAPDILCWLLHSAKLPYERAITVTQQILEYAVLNDTKLSLIDIDTLKTFDSSINDGIYSTLIASRAVINRRSEGGSNPVHTKKAIRRYRKSVKNVNDKINHKTLDSLS